MSDVELEDALSCNDEVLNEIYQYHDPPVPGIIRYIVVVINDLTYPLLAQIACILLCYISCGGDRKRPD